MNKIIKVTLIETVLSDKGADKVKKYFTKPSSDNEDDIDWEALGIAKSKDVEDEDTITLTDDDYKETELEASIPFDSIDYYYQTPRKNTTSVKLKTGHLLTIKESIKYIDKNLHS